MSFRDRNTFVDLFGGTGAVSYALRNDFEVISNDLQVYSAIIMKAIMNKTVFTIDEENDFNMKVKRNIKRSEELLKSELSKEKFYLFESENIDEYTVFSNNTPHIYDYKDATDDFGGLQELCKDIDFDKKNNMNKILTTLSSLLLIILIHTLELGNVLKLML